MVNGVPLATWPGAFATGRTGVAHVGAFLRTANPEVADVTLGQFGTIASTYQSIAPAGICSVVLFDVVVVSTLA